MSKFNVGDKVKVIKYNTFAKKEYLGKIYENPELLEKE